MLRRLGLVIAVALWVASCGAGDSGAVVTPPPPVENTPPPRELQYGVGTGSAGIPFGPYVPTVIGTVTSYAVSPALPAGLTLDSKTGAISGTPQSASSATYTVTASNSGGSVTATLSVLILAAPTLTYATPVTATLGMALTPLVPTLRGDADSFYIAPLLPAGLTLDSATGIVSGTPSSQRVAVTYTIWGSNRGGGYTSADLELGVDPGPDGTPVTGVFRGETVSGLGYESGTHRGVTGSSGEFTYEVGRGIAFSVGAVSIGKLPTAQAFVTPVDLVPGGTGSSNHVLNVVRFLMMLDQDGNPNNGIQISAAVTAAAASWSPVDFETTDLPTTLASLIQQASAADGVSHRLPDATTAQASLRTGFYCARAGAYIGTYAADASPSSHSDFLGVVSPDGGMSTSAYPSITLTGFDVHTQGALSPLLDGTFAQKDAEHVGSIAVNVQGYFADATVLKGAYVSDVAGTFQAVAETGVAATYKFTGTYTFTPNDPATGSPSTGPVSFGMNDSNQVSGAVFGVLAGKVSGNTLTGTVSARPDPYSRHIVKYAASGTYSNTDMGITLNGQAISSGATITFTTVGCRGN